MEILAPLLVATVWVGIIVFIGFNIPTYDYERFFEELKNGYCDD